MNNMLKYTKMLLLFVLVLGLTSCDSEEETEYNLPGEWYTSCLLYTSDAADE